MILMKRSESQSLYKALPGAYITYTSNDKDSYRCKSADKTVLKINYWITEELKIEDIYYPKIVSQIVPEILNFKNKDYPNVKVDNRLMNLNRANKQIKFLEVKNFKDEKKLQIIGHIDPKLFYCPRCGNITFLEKDSDITKMVCSNDNCSYKGRRLSQYNRVWVCSCGESYPISSYEVDPKKYRYLATSNNGFIKHNGESERIREKKCPQCGNLCSMENATDPKAFFPKIITSVKLTDGKYASLCENNDGKDLIIEKYIKNMSNEEYIKRADEILINKDNLIDNVDDEFETLILNNINLSDKQNDLNNETDIEEETVYKILEYETLKSKKVTSLDRAVENAIRFEKIEHSEDIYSILNAMKISDMFSVSDIEIINTAYGFTRKYQSCEELQNENEQLNLRAFSSNNPRIAAFYNIRIKTEGIVIDIDRKAIYEYIKNSFTDKYNLRLNELSEQDLKKWFLDKHIINTRLIKKYQDIDDNDESITNIFTKCAYTLLHTISHMFINVLSKYCGIDKSSLCEMIFVNNCSIFIYSQTNQGAVLGAITQTFDKYLYELLKDTYNDNKTCTFDPICMSTSNGSCCACTYLDEVACEHFNKDLSRRLLYGYENEKDKINNFWEEI